MDLDRDASSTDEYFVTAVQIFDYCGADSSGTLRVDALMEKFAPFIKTNKSECSYLRSLLDPGHSNPEINVTKLAFALNQYSESQKVKVDLDESFSLKIGPMDSDSGISTDGFQMLEDLQSELREKAHLAHQLRSQLDFTDRQHEEALATLTAERDSLRAHLNMLREENMTLTHVRRDYEEACDRLCSSEQALTAARRDLDSAKRQHKAAQEQASALENEKVTLQELLSKSKDECHRINEMYLSRQTALREQNETLRAEHADLAARLQDQDELLQQLIKEKVMLEMELKEMLNRHNQTQTRLDRSIDVSYTDDQMLTALDTLSADSRFTQENRILDEESFISALKENQGRATNLSLFDEIRLSFSSTSRQSLLDETQCCLTENLDNSLFTVGTQTDEGNDAQTDSDDEKPAQNCVEQFDEKEPIRETVSSETQTDDYLSKFDNNNCGDCIRCLECVNLNKYTTKLETDLKNSKTLNREMHGELQKYEDNLIILQKVLEEGNDRNDMLQTIVSSLQKKLSLLEAVCDNQKERIDSIDSACESFCSECQTSSDVSSVSTQTELPCAQCARNAPAAPRSLRRYLWEAVKWLAQLFAVLCFVCAVCVLYGVTTRARCGAARGSGRNAVPWRWIDAHEFMDLLLRIEYVADVPM